MRPAATLIALAAFAAASLHAADAEKGAAALSLLKTIDEGFVQIFEKVAPSVVVIEATKRADPDDAEALKGFEFFLDDRKDRDPAWKLPAPPARSEGSGFIIRGDGVIITNHHVIAAAEKLRVRLKDGRAFPATVIGTDDKTDIAVLRIEAKDLPAVEMGDSQALRVGQLVCAIGTPFNQDYSFTVGWVSGKGRTNLLGPTSTTILYEDYIQTDAFINPGNSGGPLFNIRGEVVGINTAINAAAQGIGFAIPIDMVKKILPALYGPGHVARSWIGVQIQAVTAELARSFGLDRPRGALVAAVVPDGPAAAAGVKPGDVVTRFDGTPVQKESDLPWLASTAGIGRTVDVEVHRDGAAKTLKIKLEAMPGADREARGGGKGGREDKAEERAPGAVGMRIAPLDRALAERLDVKGGVAIVRVEPGTPAARAGLRRGDVILQLDGREVSEPKAVAGALETLRAGQTVRLWIQRGDGRQFVALSK
jgi:Do/DeqQ family serine protease